MRKLLSIRSISDVVTNSSTEVFLFKCPEEVIPYIQKLMFRYGCEAEEYEGVIHFKTESDILKLFKMESDHNWLGAINSLLLKDDSLNISESTLISHREFEECPNGDERKILNDRAVRLYTPWLLGKVFAVLSNQGFDEERDCAAMSVFADLWGVHDDD